MQRIYSLGRSLHAFWANAHQRMIAVWVLVVLAVLVLGYGIYTAIDGQREYSARSDKIASIVQRQEEFAQQFPTAQVDGAIKPDLTSATESDLMFIAMLRRDEANAENQRIDADNQRRAGIRLIGIGVIGLALAYLVLPENQSRLLSTEAAAASRPSEDSSTK